MSMRKPYLVVAAVIAVASAKIIGAEPFDTTVAQLLQKDGAFKVQTSLLKQSVEQNNIETQSYLEEVRNNGRRRGPGRGNPGRQPDHRRPDRRPGHRNPGNGHRDWGRWRGHPGWGHHGRWDWRGGRPYWWGWGIWRGSGRLACIDYYGSLYSSCNTSCLQENDYCVRACGYDSDCVAQCNLNADYCGGYCRDEYSARIATCPLY